MLVDIQPIIHFALLVSTDPGTTTVFLALSEGFVSSFSLDGTQKTSPCMLLVMLQPTLSDSWGCSPNRVKAVVEAT